MSTATPAVQFDSPEGGQEEKFQKPRAGVYTVMLLISFLALSVSSFCLYKEMQAYNFDFSAKSARYDAVTGAPPVGAPAPPAQK